MDIKRQETQNNKKQIINVITITLIQSNVPWNKRKTFAIIQFTKYMWKIVK